MFPSTVILSNYLNSIDKFFLFYDWGFDVYRAPTMWQALYPAPPAPRLHLYQLELSLQELRNCHHFRRDETGSDSPASPNLSVPKQMSGPRFSWFSGGCTGNPYFWIGGGSSWKNIFKSVQLWTVSRSRLIAEGLKPHSCLLGNFS